MDNIESLNHTKWDCKYHVVFIPKGRYGQLRVHLGEVFRTLAQHKESRIEEGHLLGDHVRSCLLSRVKPRRNIQVFMVRQYQSCSACAWCQARCVICKATNYLAFKPLHHVAKNYLFSRYDHSRLQSRRPQSCA